MIADVQKSDKPYRVLCSESNTPEWLKLRKTGIGASEAAAILGQSGWGTPRTVWLEKTSENVVDIGNDLMWFGHRAEPVVVDFLESHPERFRWIGSILASEGLLQSTLYPWLLGTLDRQVVTPLGLVVPLEIKSVNDFVAREWWEGGEESDDEFGSGPGRGSRAVVPVKYQTQVQQQMAVTGAPFAYVAVWLGKAHVEVIRVERDEEFIQKFLVGILGQFWDFNVLAGVAPEPTADDRLWDIYPGVLGKTIVATPEILEIVGLFREAKVDEGLIKAQLDGKKATKTRGPEQGLKFQIAHFMGDAQELLHPDTNKTVHTLKGQNTQRRVDLARLQEEFPDAYAACVGEQGWTRVHRGTKESIDFD